MALAALLEMAAEDIWVRDPEWAKLCRLLPPKLPFTATVANGRDGWLAVLGTRGFHRPLSFLQRTFQYVATVQAVTDETCHKRT